MRTVAAIAFVNFANFATGCGLIVGNVDGHYVPGDRKPPSARP